MAQNIDPAVWETKLRKLMRDYQGHQTLSQWELQTLNTLGRLLAQDDEVELHPYDTRVFTVKIRERSDKLKAVIELSEMADAIADEFNLNINDITCEEVK